jgi:large subunit ribosomal protein L4
MKAPLYSQEGKKKGEVVLNPAIFSARSNRRLLHLVQKAYAANLHHGTHDTKTRKEVRGGGKKPWRQKGTGRARHGSIRSPIWKGGGVVFGPHPRDYFVALPSAMRKKALIAALSLRADQKNLVLLEGIKLETPKTKEWVEIVKVLPFQKKRALCVVKNIDPNLKRASQNVSQLVELRQASQLNAFHVLQREKLFIEQEALPVIENRLLAAAEMQREAKESEGLS